MSEPLSTIFHGDVIIETGYDTAEFGFGDFEVNRSMTMNKSFSTSNASLSINATSASNLTTNSGTLTLASTDATATGIVHLTSTGTATNSLDIDSSFGGISIDAVKDSHFNLAGVDAKTLTFSTSGNVSDKITMNTVTSTASDSINIDSDLGGVRINSDGIAGSGTGIALTAVDDSSFTTTDGKLRMEVNSSTVTDNLELVNTAGTSSGDTGAGAIDINATAGGFSIDSVKSSRINMETTTPSTLTILSQGNSSNEILIRDVSSTSGDAVKLQSSAGGIRLDSDGAAGSGTGIVLTSIDDSSFTTTDGKLRMEVNSSTVTDNLELVNTVGTNDGTTGAGAIDINAVAGGFSIDSVKSSNMTVTSSGPATLKLSTSGDAGNKILLNTVTSTASDSITIDSDAGGVRVISEGAAGGSNGIVMTSVDDSSFTTTDGNLLFHVNSSTTTDVLELKNTAGTNDGTSGAGAIDINAVAGGVSIDAVKSSRVQINSTTAEELLLQTTGSTGNKITLNTVTSTASDSINIDSDLGGVRINSDGLAGGNNGIVMTAIDDSSFTTSDGSLTLEVNSLTTTDHLVIKNSTSGDNNAVDIDSTKGGISLDAIKNSNFSITSTPSSSISSSGTQNPVEIITSAAHNFTTGESVTITGHDNTDLNGTFTITVIDATTFSIPVDGSVNGPGTATGTVSPDASTLTISTSGHTGNKIALSTATSTATDAIDIDSAFGGVRVDAGLGIVMTAVDDSSLTTTNGSITLDVNSGDTTDDLILKNTNGTDTDAIHIESLAGGILIDANGGDGNSPISIQTDDIINGISIATTTPGVPVTIGSASSTTTVVGDLIVSGTTTTVDTATLTIEDNIIIVNSGPSGSADGGMAVKRFQEQNDAGTGDVVSDTACESGSEHAVNTFIASATATTVGFNNDGPTPPSSVDDFYNGWWIKITGGTGANQVRRIKDYNGTTRVATLFTTADETANPQTPPTGADWTTIPSNTDSTYELYSCPFVVSIYDESADEWVLGCTSTDPVSAGQPTITKYLDLHVNNLQVDGDLTVNGTINGLIPDILEVVTLVDNTTTAVEISNSRIHGAYFIMVIEVDSDNITATNVNTGAHATFSAAAREGKAGHIVRLASARGADSEKLDLEYNVGEKIKLKYRPPPGGTGANRYYLVKLQRLGA